MQKNEEEINFFTQNEEDEIFNKLVFKLKWSAQLREIPVSLKHAQHLFKVWDFGEIPTRLHWEFTIS